MLRKKMSHFPKILPLSLYWIMINFAMFTTEIASSESSTCTRKNCSPTGSTVRFPFQISDGHDRCGYPGFELSCQNTTGDAILSLPSGDFAVSTIYYRSQVLTIDDPDKCLPRRFLERKFSLSGTPFRVPNLGSFTFFNCSSVPETGDGTGVEPVIVPCLSGSDYAVLALPTEIFASVLLSTPPPSCSVVSTAVLAPVTASAKWWEGNWGFYLRALMVLTWREPNCGECEARGGECGLASGGGDFEIGCFRLPNKHGVSKAVQYTLYFITFLGILGFLCFNCRPSCHHQETNTITFRRIRWRNNNQHNHQLPDTNSNTITTILPRRNEVNINRLPPTGIDKKIIEMYPKRLIGESQRYLKSDYNSCSICLTEYQPDDTVRTLPNCFHYFHSNCIDEWLKLNASCPICRNSPLISPCTLPTQSANG